jgi:tetratricopeptide (TPR) repeat protein
VVSICLLASELPELPSVNTAGFLPEIRRQVENAIAVARAHPRDANAVGALAMTLHAYQRYDAAGQTYLRAHLLAPQNFEWLYLLGAVRMARGSFAAAAQAFDDALRVRPGDLASQLRLAESCMALGRWDDADLVYRQVLAQHHDLPQAWYGLGRVQSAREDHTAAAQSFAQACNLFPRYGSAQFALAAELRRIGQFEQAKEHLAASSTNLAIEPPIDDPLFSRIHELNRSTTAHLLNGSALEKAGQLTQAIYEEEAALEVDPRNVQAHVNLIALYAKTGDSGKAKSHFESAIQLNPGRSDAWYNYAVLLSESQRNAEAESAYRCAIEINPHYAEAHSNVGLIYQQRGALDEAASEFRQAIADRPDYPPARFQLARILVNRHEYQEAIQHFLRSLEPANDQTPAYIYALGATYARAGDQSHALEYLRKAHDAAAAYNQPQLIASIDRDLATLQSRR